LCAIGRVARPANRGEKPRTAALCTLRSKKVASEQQLRDNPPERRGGHVADDDDDRDDIDDEDEDDEEEEVVKKPAPVSKRPVGKPLVKKAKGPPVDEDIALLREILATVRSAHDRQDRYLWLLLPVIAILLVIAIFQAVKL
jgi:hypothetical protein